MNLSPSEQATLSKIRAGTHVVVPVEPRRAMLEKIKPHCGLISYTEFGPAWVASPERAYRAMISAAQGPDHD